MTVIWLHWKALWADDDADKVMTAGKQKTFSIDTPSGLLAKLHWEVSRLDVTPGHAIQVIAYRALNCATTAWHMCDWLFESGRTDDALKLRMVELFGGQSFTLKHVQDWASKDRAIAICRQLATASKHFEIRDRPDAGVKAEIEERITRNEDGSANMWVRVVIRDGSEEFAPHEVFWRAYAFWDQRLQELGLGH